MSNTISDALELMKMSGVMACCYGRPRDDCPYDVMYFPAAYEAWTNGWDQAQMMLKMESQLGFLKEMHDTDAPDFIKTVAKFRGFQAGVPYAEAFCQQKMYPQGLTKRILP